MQNSIHQERPIWMRRVWSACTYPGWVVTDQVRMLWEYMMSSNHTSIAPREEFLGRKTGSHTEGRPDFRILLTPGHQWRHVFRWFKFTLKPPYSGASERSLLAIWDTSHWKFFVKFGLRTAWDISYDILLSLFKFVNFWRLQGRLSILAKIGCLQKIKVFSMKERQGFNATWGF